MAGYLDVEAVWRPVLTSTKEPLREGVAVLIEQRALSTFIRFVLLPFQPFTHLLFLFFFSFHCNYTCSAKRSSRRGWAKSLVNMNLQRVREGGGLLADSLCGNIRL